MALDIEILRALCNKGAVHWSVHAFERIQQRGIFRNDVIHAIQTGKIIEQYPDAFPYPACLIFGSNIRKGEII